MNTLLKPLLETILGSLKSRAELQLEVLALRQQLAMVAQRDRKRLRFHPQERWFWILLYRLWPSCLQTLKVFQSDTLVRWHRKGFSFYLRFKSLSGGDGRPTISREIRQLIRRMSRDNVGWGAPRIHGELRMLGIDVCESTVAKYMIRHRKPPSQSWRTFLDNHASDTASVDFFTVPTATFRVLYVFVILKHDKREVIHFNITQNPTAQWTAQQLVEAFPIDPPPRYLLRDRDAIYGERFCRRVKSLGIKDVISAPRFGSIRRECLNHVIVLNEGHLRRQLEQYFAYYHEARTHLSLVKQCPRHRTVESPDRSRVVAFPHIGGLHHEYRLAA